MTQFFTRLTLVALVAFSAISTDLYLPAIPDIVAALGTSHSNGQLTLSVFMLGFALGQLVFGPLSDRFGRQPPLRAGILVYVAVSIMCVFATSIEMLLIGRGVQGLAAAVGPVMARAIINDSYDKKEVARVMALVAAAMAIVPSVAPVLGSWLTHFDWRTQFVALTAFGAVAFVLTLLFLKESCPSIGENSVRVGDIVKRFKVFLCHRQFLGYLLTGCAIFSIMFAYISSSSFLVIEMLGVEAKYFGYTFMLVVLGYAGGAIFSTKISKVFSVKQIIRQGLFIAFAAIACLFLQVIFTTSLTTLLASATAFFFAGGLVLPNVQMGAISTFPKAAGSASSLVGFSQATAAALAGFFAGYYYNATIVPMTIVVMVCTLCMVAGYRMVVEE